MRWGLALLVVLVLPRAAGADRYEATIAVRPGGGVTRLAETGVDTAVVVPSGGGSVALAWGVRDWLDVGIDLGATMLRPAHYDTATLEVMGTTTTGELDRVTRVAHLQIGATLRLGATWIPTVHVGVGVGGRQQSAARLRIQTGTGDVLVREPDGEGAQLGLDLLATVRVGFDHRFDRHWTIGVSVGATQHMGLGMADLQRIDALAGVAFSWYPL